MNNIPKKILIIRFSSIGDIVLCSPLIRCIKQKYPDAELCFLTKKIFRDLVVHHPNISKVFSYKNSLNEIISLLKLEKFDLVIDLHNNFRSKMIRFLLGGKSLVYKKGNAHKFSLVFFKKSPFENEHVVERYFESVACLNIYNDGKGLSVFISNEMEQNYMPKIKSIGNKYAVLVLGANHFTKTIPINKLEEIVEKIDCPIVLLGGNDQLEIGNQLSLKFPNLNNHVAQTNLLESALWIKHAQYIITPDTGMMHVATAFHKKIYVIWGSTVPAFGFWPYYGSKNEVRSIDIIVPNLSCKPCSRMGKSTCPKGHFKCMNDQDFTNIIFE